LNGRGSFNLFEDSPSLMNSSGTTIISNQSASSVDAQLLAGADANASTLLRAGPRQLGDGNGIITKSRNACGRNL